MGTAAKQLVRPKIDEVSGVDWPAHLAPGWVVMKAVGDADLEAAVQDDPAGAGEGADMTEANKAEAAKKAAEEGTPEERLAKAEADLTAERERAEKAEKERDEAVAKAAGKSTEDVEFEKAMATLPEPVRKRMVEDHDRVVKAEAEVAKAREAQLSAEYLAKAAAYTTLPTTPEAMAKTLREVDEKLPEDVAKEVRRLLDSGVSVLKTSEVLKEHGGYGEATTALNSLNAKRDELMTADPKLTKAQAFEKALDMSPELVSAYEAEIGGSR